MRILVVCIGNVCRSPLAERLLQQRLDALGPGHVVTSAGIQGRDGHPMERNAATNLVRLGGDPEGFASRRLTPAILDDVDLVLTATKDVRTQVLQLAPSRMRSTFTLGEIAAVLESPESVAATPPLEGGLVAHVARLRSVGSGAADVDDPIGRSAETHQRVADHLDALVTTIAGPIVRLGTPTT